MILSIFKVDENHFSVSVYTIYSILPVLFINNKLFNKPFIANNNPYNVYTWLKH